MRIEKASPPGCTSMCDYAQLEAQRRGSALRCRAGFALRRRAMQRHPAPDPCGAQGRGFPLRSGQAGRIVLLHVCRPARPARRAAGLRFCFYHAWYEASVIALQADCQRPSERNTMADTHVHGEQSATSYKSGGAHRPPLQDAGWRPYSGTCPNARDSVRSTERIGTGRALARPSVHPVERSYRCHLPTPLAHARCTAGTSTSVAD